MDNSIRLELEQLSRDTRADVLRMIFNAGSGNPGSALSSTDILVWLLLHEMRLDRNNPKWEKRDRLILSKGHCAPAFYSICCRFGWIEKSELLSYRRFNSRLQTHPEYGSFDGIDFPSGSLGQGLSGANGMALAARYRNLKEVRFFVVLGDGELQEGQIWEAAMTAAHYRLNNVIAIVDRNGFQGDSSIDEQMGLEPLQEKWRAFGWEVKSADGHSYLDLSAALHSFDSSCPKMIIARTVKGRGVSFMENNNDWHVGGKKFNRELFETALADLGE